MLIYEDKAGNIKFFQRDTDKKPIPATEILDSQEEENEEDLEKEKKDGDV